MDEEEPLVFVTFEEAYGQVAQLSERVFLLEGAFAAIANDLRALSERLSEFQPRRNYKISKGLCGAPTKQGGKCGNPKGESGLCRLHAGLLFVLNE